MRSTYPELSYEIAKNMPIYIYDNIVENSKTNSEDQREIVIYHQPGWIGTPGENPTLLTL